MITKLIELHSASNEVCKVVVSKICFYENYEVKGVPHFEKIHCVIYMDGDTILSVMESFNEVDLLVSNALDGA